MPHRKPPATGRRYVVLIVRSVGDDGVIRTDLIVDHPDVIRAALEAIPLAYGPGSVPPTPDGEETAVARIGKHVVPVGDAAVAIRSDLDRQDHTAEGSER